MIRFLPRTPRTITHPPAPRVTWTPKPMAPAHPADVLPPTTWADTWLTPTEARAARTTDGPVR